jgi:hypothetical protein
MGCFLQSIGIIIILVLLLPVMLFSSLFGRVRSTTFTQRRHTADDNDIPTPEYKAEEEEPTDRINKPIDQSTVEYIDYEEVDDKK